MNTATEFEFRFSLPPPAAGVNEEDAFTVLIREELESLLELVELRFRGTPVQVDGFSLITKLGEEIPLRASERFRGLCAERSEVGIPPGKGL